MDFLDKYAPGLFARIVSRIRRSVGNDAVGSVLITQAGRRAMDFLDKYAPGLFARIVSRIRRSVGNDEVDSVLITQAQFDETLRPIIQGHRDEWSDFEGDLVKATAPDSISPGLATDEPPVVNESPAEDALIPELSAGDTSNISGEIVEITDFDPERDIIGIFYTKTVDADTDKPITDRLKVAPFEDGSGKAIMLDEIPVARFVGTHRLAVRDFALIEQ